MKEKWKKVRKGCFFRILTVIAEIPLDNVWAHLQLLNTNKHTYPCKPRMSHSGPWLLMPIPFPFTQAVSVPPDICTLHWFPCEAERHSINGELFRQSSLRLFIDMSGLSDASQRANVKTCQTVICWAGPFKYETPGNTEGCGSSFSDILRKVEGCNAWRFSDSFSIVACLLKRL